jgi:hypothetical protein
MEIEFEGDEASLISAIREVEELRMRLLDLAADDSSGGSRAETGTTIAAGLLLNASLALQSAVDYQCTLAQPPEEIAGRPIGEDGAMIHRCYHGLNAGGPHCWSGSWDRIDCPS